MAARALAGELVVRLKGGDPYLFGRGAEEAAALLERGIAYEMVPGVSSALAAPAAAGIPLTHRDLASSVTIVTGHEREGEGRVRWDRLASGADTLVVLMGATKLRQLTRSIILAGRSPATPAAVVMAATRPEQRQVVATLAGIADAAEHAGIGAPAVLVVGEVAALSSVLAAPALSELALSAAGG
jgi:uroporphyrin-III C-methyltransferase